MHVFFQNAKKFRIAIQRFYMNKDLGFIYTKRRISFRYVGLRIFFFLLFCFASYRNCETRLTDRSKLLFPVVFVLCGLCGFFFSRDISVFDPILCLDLCLVGPILHCDNRDG